jgi:hypothetical protein
MHGTRSRHRMRVGLAAAATGLMTAVVLSGVAKVQDASDRAH